MNSVEILVSFIVTWAVILIPPALIRALVRKPLLKGAAIMWVVVLFFGNQIFFAWLTEEASTRPFLIFGAVAAYFVLIWKSQRQVKNANLELRRSMGYDQEPINTPRGKDVPAAGDQSREKKEQGKESETAQGAFLGFAATLSESKAMTTDANVKTSRPHHATIDLLGERPPNWSRAIFRLWTVVSIVWVSVIALQTAVSINDHPSSGWFITSYTTGDELTPDQAENLLRAQIRWIAERGDAPSSEPKITSEYDGIIKRKAAEKVDEITAAAKTIGIPRPANLARVAEITGLTPAQIVLDEETAIRIAMGLELVVAGKESRYAWPASFDTRRRVNEIEWTPLLIFMLGGPLLTLGFGLTARWAFSGLR